MAYINVDEVYILDNTGLQVDMATDIPFADAGFSDAQKEQARKNIGAGGSNRNLLDNWYFVGGGSQLGNGVFPINQKGQTSYTGTVASSIDRWKLSNGNTSISLSASGMTIYTNGSGYGYGGQELETEYALDGTYTFSVLLADGTLYSTPTNQNLELPSGLLFYFASNKSVNWRNPANTTCETIAAVKLEKGTVSTLANDPPPDFAEEFEKCRYYLRYIPLTRYAIAIDGANAYMTMIGMPMRGVPTPSLPTAGGVRDAGGASTITSATITGFANKIATVQFALSASRSYVVGYIYDTVLCLSAEL